MTARFSWNHRVTRGHRPRLQPPAYVVLRFATPLRMESPGFISSIETVGFFEALPVEVLGGGLAHVAVIATHDQRLLQVRISDESCDVSVVDVFRTGNMACGVRRRIAHIH